jgi:hypothetical protein
MILLTQISTHIKLSYSFHETKIKTIKSTIPQKKENQKSSNFLSFLSAIRLKIYSRIIAHPVDFPVYR